MIANATMEKKEIYLNLFFAVFEFSNISRPKREK